MATTKNNDPEKNRTPAMAPASVQSMPQMWHTCLKMAVVEMLAPATATLPPSEWTVLIE
jgi:hypothetical protein